MSAFCFCKANLVLLELDNRRDSGGDAIWFLIEMGGRMIQPDRNDGPDIGTAHGGAADNADIGHIGGGAVDGGHINSGAGRSQCTRPVRCPGSPCPTGEDSQMRVLYLTVENDSFSGAALGLRFFAARFPVNFL